MSVTPRPHTCSTMNQLAKIMRARRAAAGALQLASPEVKFKIDTETHNPLDVGMYQVRVRVGYIHDYF